MIPPVQETQWRLGDFFWVLAGGLGGAFVGGIFLAAQGGIDALEQLTFMSTFGVLLPAQYAGHLAVLVLAAKRRGTNLVDGLGLTIEGRHSGYLGIGALLQIAVALVSLPLAYLVGLDESAQEGLEAIGNASGGMQVSLVLLTVALVVPVVEELWFRGLLMRYLQQARSDRVAVVISSAAFAIAHAAGLSVESFAAAAAVALPGFFLAGLVLGQLALKHGNLGRSIFTHAGFNLLGVIVLLAAPGVTV